jgi:hypothetical protein
MKGLLDTADAQAWLTRMSPAEIDHALSFVEMLERGRIMNRTEAAGWRWKLLACWADHELEQRRSA